MLAAGVAQVDRPRIRRRGWAALGAWERFRIGTSLIGALPVSSGLRCTQRGAMVLPVAADARRVFYFAGGPRSTTRWESSGGCRAVWCAGSVGHGSSAPGLDIAGPFPVCFSCGHGHRKVRRDGEFMNSVVNSISLGLRENLAPNRLDTPHLTSPPVTGERGR